MERKTRMARGWGKGSSKKGACLEWDSGDEAEVALAMQSGSTPDSSSAFLKPLYWVLYIVLIVSPGSPWDIAQGSGHAHPSGLISPHHRPASLTNIPMLRTWICTTYFTGQDHMVHFFPFYSLCQNTRTSPGTCGNDISHSPKNQPLLSLKKPLFCDRGSTEIALPEVNTFVENGWIRP